MYLFVNGTPLRSRRLRATFIDVGGKASPALPRTQLEVTEAGIKGGVSVYHCYDKTGKYVGLYSEMQLVIGQK